MTAQQPIFVSWVAVNNNLTAFGLAGATLAAVTAATTIVGGLVTVADRDAPAPR
jgi:hypothetical protein